MGFPRYYSHSIILNPLMDIDLQLLLPTWVTSFRVIFFLFLFSAKIQLFRLSLTNKCHAIFFTLRSVLIAVPVSLETLASE